jgi:hypothetical protein
MKRARGIIMVSVALFVALVIGSAEASRFDLPYRIKQVCLQLNHGLLGVSPIQYRLTFLSVGKGRYLITGTSYSETITYPPVVIQKVVTGGAAIIDGMLEVSTNATDIQDRPNTDTVEALAVTDVHMLLNPRSFCGTFEAVQVHYPASGEEGEPIAGSTSGDVRRIRCP